MKRHVVIGTAGHIDHGKTALVKALTNMETDRLHEEISRGMTIDLGFAFLGDNVTIIDVPGHEKFVRNMVAGVSTIDFVLLVIAADDGIMPQTIEHLEILNLLQIKHGLIVISKTDLVEEEWLELVEEEVRELTSDTFLADAPIFRVSSITGAGIPELTQQIKKLAASLPPRQDRGIFRLPIDRVFTMKGFGTVAAGTVLSGKIQTDQTVELLPRQTKLRIRGLQIHGHLVKQVSTGDRAAINLSGIDKENIKRGDVLALTGIYQPTIFFDSRIYLLKTATKRIKHNVRVRLHIGTSEIIARLRLLDLDELQPGQEAFVQLHCEQAVVAEVGDRFVIRNYSPLYTIGGGVILQVNPPRHRRFSKELINRLKIFESGNVVDIIEQAILKGKIILKKFEDIIKASGMTATELQPIIENLLEQNKIKIITKKGKSFYVHNAHLQEVEKNILKQLSDFHQKNPLKRGMSTNEIQSLIQIRTELFFIQSLVRMLQEAGKIIFADQKIRLADYKIKLSVEQEKLVDQIQQYFITQKFSPPHTDSIISQLKVQYPDVEKIIAYLLEHQLLVYIDDGYLLHSKWVEEARKVILAHFKEKEELTIGEFRDKIQASRKYTVPLLNYFDQQGITTRQEDVRVAAGQ